MPSHEAKLRYIELCARRDAINREIGPKQAELEELNRLVQKYQEEAYQKAVEISTLRGGQKWLDLKSELASLAKQGVKVDPTPTHVPLEIEVQKPSWFSRVFG